MAYEIKVPELGESIVEATVSTWLKKEGDLVNVGETVVELATDKVDVEVAAEKSGVLERIDRREGEEVRIGDVLGVIQESDSVRKEARVPVEKDERADAERSVGSTQQSGLPERDSDTEKEKRITPVAAKIAEDHKVDIHTLKGTGPGGKITKHDVEYFLKKKDDEQAHFQLTETTDAVPKPSEKRVRMSRRRQTIAQRLVEAQRTAAMLTTFNEIDMSEVIRIRNAKKEIFEKKHGVKLGFMSFFVKAVIAALREFPELNAEIQGTEIVYKYYYDIGIAVGAEGGLVVPVIRNADILSFAEIEMSIREFARKANEGTLTLDDLRGGTFSITNGGVYGSLLSTPILNPPQVAILGLHKIEDRPIVKNGEIVVRPMMYVALTYDHRIVDGRESVQFLVRVKEFIEDPTAMLLDL